MRVAGTHENRVDAWVVGLLIHFLFKLFVSLSSSQVRPLIFRPGIGESDQSFDFQRTRCFRAKGLAPYSASRRHQC